MALSAGTSTCGLQSSLSLRERSNKLVGLSRNQAFFESRSSTGLKYSANRQNSKGKDSTKSLEVRANLFDFVGGDLIGLDLGKWLSDVENYGAIGFYAPPEGGAEGRYASVLKTNGYHLMNISARGLGDPEAYLLKPHGVRPPHLGKQPVARFYTPPEVDYRLASLPRGYKGLVLWIGEAKVLAKNELQFLAYLPVLRPNVKVVCEMGGSRKLYWKPLKELVGLPSAPPASALAASSEPQVLFKTEEKEKVVVQ